MELHIHQATQHHTSKQCGANQISASGQCIPYSISGGMVTGATINTNDNSIIISINAEDDGTLTVSPTKTTRRYLHGTS